jgi:hypothetical protein
MKSLRHLHLVGALGKLRTGAFQGKDYFVVPVTALREGAFQTLTAATPELVPLSVLQVAPQGWNGRPVMLGHPVKNGQQISANDPRTLELQALGTIFNARIDNRALKLEAWLDPARVATVSGAARMLERLSAGDTLEVSVGCFVITDDTSGVHEGQPYHGTWKELVPDHLAILAEGTTGACSVAAGCGARHAASFVAATVEPPNPYASALKRPTVDDTAGLEAIKRGRDEYLDFARRPAPATSTTFTQPPDAYAEGVARLRRKEELL